jgi:hypothetical protein
MQLVHAGVKTTPVSVIATLTGMVTSMPVVAAAVVVGTSAPHASAKSILSRGFGDVRTGMGGTLPSAEGYPEGRIRISAPVSTGSFATS